MTHQQWAELQIKAAKTKDHITLYTSLSVGSDVMQDDVYYIPLFRHCEYKQSRTKPAANWHNCKTRKYA